VSLDQLVSGLFGTKLAPIMVRVLDREVYDMSARLTLPNRRNHVTQKVRIAGQRTLHISVY